MGEKERVCVGMWAYVRASVCVLVHVCTCVFRHSHHCTHVEIRGQLAGVNFSFHHVRPGAQTQTFKLGIHRLCLLSHLTGSPVLSFLIYQSAFC